ncbi:DUF2092 domain-containing protein [Chitinibacteraceae bacterium HSL-7]
MKKAVTLSLASALLAGSVYADTDMPSDQNMQAVETRAVLALNRMSNYLDTLKQFEVSSDVDTDYLSDDKQIITKTRQVLLRTRFPDGLYASISHPARQRDFYFDGKHATLYAPTKGYYATVEAPATVGELINVLDEKYGVDVPLADLFEWSGTEASTSEFEAARYAGAAVINDRVCDQYAYRSQGAQWQLWIERSDTPLPCRLAIANDDEDRLRTTITYHWHTSAKFSPSQFVFKAPKNAMKIDLVKAKAE